MTKYGQFRQHAGSPVPFKPPRDRTVRTKDVIACPECGAPVGEYCRRGDGSKPYTAAHTARRRMAVRRLNQEKDEQ